MSSTSDFHVFRMKIHFIYTKSLNISNTIKSNAIKESNQREKQNKFFIYESYSCNKLIIHFTQPWKHCYLIQC